MSGWENVRIPTSRIPCWNIFVTLHCYFLVKQVEAMLINDDAFFNFLKVAHLCVVLCCMNWWVIHFVVKLSIVHTGRWVCSPSLCVVYKLIVSFTLGEAEPVTHFRWCRHTLLSTPKYLASVPLNRKDVVIKWYLLFYLTKDVAGWLRTAIYKLLFKRNVQMYSKVISLFYLSVLWQW